MSAPCDNIMWPFQPTNHQGILEVGQSSEATVGIGDVYEDSDPTPLDQAKYLQHR